MDLDIGAGHTINSSLVPEHLHELIPLIEKWGYSELTNQDLLITEMKRHRPAELQAFNVAMDRHDKAIREWGAGLLPGKSHADDYSEDERDHPYWLFLNAIKLREVSGPLTIEDPAIEAAKEQYLNERREHEFRKSINIADEEFREGNYREVVKQLKPYVDLLSPALSKKFAFAKNKL